MSILPRSNNGYCGVPQCKTYRKDGISMFHLPKEVRDSSILLRKWSRALRMGKQFPKLFLICELHFAKNQVLKPINRGATKKRAFLVKDAFPTQNLPKSVIGPKAAKLRSKRLLVGSIERRRSTCDGENKVENINMIDDKDNITENNLTENGNEPNQPPQDSGITQCKKATQVNFNPIKTMSNSPRSNNGYCGVPQCNSYRKNGISMFHLPKEVRDSSFLLRKWSRTLRMGKQFPKQFFICELHFEKNQVLKPINRGANKKRAFLVKDAFPTQNLPKSVVGPKETNKMRSKRMLAGAFPVARIRQKCDGENIVEEINMIDDNITENNQTENGNEPNQLPEDSCTTQVNFDPITTVRSECDTDTNLKTLMGKDGKVNLDDLVNALLTN